MQRTAAGAWSGQERGGVAGTIADKGHGFPLQGCQNQLAHLSFRQGGSGDGIYNLYEAVQLPQMMAFPGGTLHAAAKTGFRQAVVIKRQAGKGRADAPL